MKTLLTVDFDFFVPEKPEWDFGHQESLLFLKMLWTSRMGMLDKMRTDGNEHGFWQQFAGVKFTGPTWVSDSHSYAYSLLKGVSRVVLFDAHHDCWEGDSLGVDKSERRIMCHNWLREWLMGGKNRKVTWVKPAWQDACTLPKDMKGKVKVITYSKGMELGLEGSVAAHICRSGCWVPPWLDKAFLAFVDGFVTTLSRGIPIPMQDGEWNALKERWTEKDLQAAIEYEKTVRKQMKEMTIGTINAGSFLNCKVEQGVTA
jgi:hypothetical protein